MQSEVQFRRKEAHFDLMGLIASILKKYVIGKELVFPRCAQSGWGLVLVGLRRSHSASR